MNTSETIKKEEESLEDNKVKELWEASQKNYVISEIKAGKNLQEVMTSLNGFKEAFAFELDTIVCSDERVPAGGGKKIGLAGQLILAPKEDVEKFVKENKGKTKVVTSHDDCGAAKKKFDQLSKDELPEGVSTPDELGIYHSKAFAKALDAEYRHVSRGEMKSEIHNARAICFDATGKFDPSVIKEMPASFVCSGPGFGLSHDYLKQELAILASIALGSHGFYNNFSSDNPLYIFVSAKKEDQLNEFVEVAEEAVKEYGDRVEVKGFVAEVAED